MSGTIITAAALIIGILVLAAGMYYFSKEKHDAESRKIYSAAAGIGAVIVIITVIKILIAGF